MFFSTLLFLYQYTERIRSYLDLAWRPDYTSQANPPMDANRWCYPSLAKVLVLNFPLQAHQGRPGEAFKLNTHDDESSPGGNSQYWANARARRREQHVYPRGREYIHSDSIHTSYKVHPEEAMPESWPQVHKFVPGNSLSRSASIAPPSFNSITLNILACLKRLVKARVRRLRYAYGLKLFLITLTRGAFSKFSNAHRTERRLTRKSQVRTSPQRAVDIQSQATRDCKYCALQTPTRHTPQSRARKPENPNFAAR